MPTSARRWTFAYHRPMRRTTLLSALIGACLCAAAASAVQATAQTTPGADPSGEAFGLWSLFTRSFDAFTVMLVLGSVVAVAVIFSNLIDVRESRLIPRKLVDRLGDLVAAGRWDDVRDLVARDETYIARVVRAALSAARHAPDRDAVRDAAELAAAEESSRWFRRVELLNVIGNLGPLIGLAGTVWGMILAFTSLGQTGGKAGPADLSLGISKALFHTLLGLCLAVPCLLSFALFRAAIDRHCTRALTLCGQLVDRIPVPFRS